MEVNIKMTKNTLGDEPYLLPATLDKLVFFCTLLKTVKDFKSQDLENINNAIENGKVLSKAIYEQIDIQTISNARKEIKEASTLDSLPKSKMEENISECLNKHFFNNPFPSGGIKSVFYAKHHGEPVIDTALAKAKVSKSFSEKMNEAYGDLIQEKKEPKGEAAFHETAMNLYKLLGDLITETTVVAKDQNSMQDEIESIRKNLKELNKSHAEKLNPPEKLFFKVFFICLKKGKNFLKIFQAECISELELEIKIFIEKMNPKGYNLDATDAVKM